MTYCYSLDGKFTILPNKTSTLTSKDANANILAWTNPINELTNLQYDFPETNDGDSKCQIIQDCSTIRAFI